MEDFISKYKGIHPGYVLERELKKRNLKKGPFALAINEYPQIINDVTKGKRGITAAQSIKIGEVLGLDIASMFVLQAYYELDKAQKKMRKTDHPDLSILRRILFWDTDMDTIDWREQYRAVIERVFERGNDDEKLEILRFYGRDMIEKVLGDSTPGFLYNT